MIEIDIFMTESNAIRKVVATKAVIVKEAVMLNGIKSLKGYNVRGKHDRVYRPTPGRTPRVLLMGSGVAGFYAFVDVDCTVRLHTMERGVRRVYDVAIEKGSANVTLIINDYNNISTLRKRGKKND